ncbi:hypothetical protein [Paraburkholderia sp. BL10I2N1]|uniref:hypothetical protein n=1 Tax=Paraburkholderia sp. BL10I2N1 TaxID=1938796 RepID=UPI00105CC7FA|nr:hypothetical protein [Paraburkholderia sp. BL10I2N1]TDN62709.1 hypothetical protein B0G77_6296 [Paraburkholderia sp. BL10I2N1]
MNLQEQIGALETGVDQLIQVALAPKAVATQEATPDIPAAAAAPDTHAVQPVPASASAEPAANVATEAAPAVATDNAADIATEELTLLVGRPNQNEITMTIGGKTVSLNPEQIGRLIEELANARASMKPEPPGAIPSGWRFASTKNPVMAAQKQSNGDRLLVMRHTGHGWVPFTFSPDMVIQMYMMLTQR